MNGQRQCGRILVGAFLLLWMAWSGSGGIGIAWAEAERVRAVRVHAGAEERAPIDRAVVDFILISEGKTPGEAEKKDEARFAEVRKQVEVVLGGKGSWRTSEIGLMPVMSEERAKREGREHVAAYRVTRSEAVELAEFTRLPELLGTLFAAGVDEVGGVEWISDRAESLYRELLGKAMVKAREKAECLAKAAGAQLGPIIHIQEGGGPVQPVARFQRTAMGVHQGASAPVPISGGEMKVRASVQAIYRLW